MTRSELELGRKAYERQAWGDARAYLLEADRASPLAAQDLERLAIVCFLVGQDKEADHFGQRTHNAYLSAGEHERAARAAIQIAMRLFNSGEYATAGGWLARGRRLLEQSGSDSVEAGYLLVPESLQNIVSGRIEEAMTGFQNAALIAERFGDADLLAM